MSTLINLSLFISLAVVIFVVVCLFILFLFVCFAFFPFSLPSLLSLSSHPPTLDITIVIIAR
jgi:hypothetical protein